MNEEPETGLALHIPHSGRGFFYKTSIKAQGPVLEYLVLLFIVFQS